ncbi:MAG: IS200/IS605 family transposase [Caldisericaceae bacterium]|nr:IS200/IS605 family transposase [Caldisericaceae bacterium]
MADSYSKIYIQVIFAVEGRQNLLKEQWRTEVFKYIAGIIKGKSHKPIIVNGVEDHVHCFIGLKPFMALSDLVRDIKNNSTNFINRRHFVQNKFNWQNGYGAFSYGHSQIDSVYRYILNQKEHHRKRSFREEYLEFLKKFEIEFNEEYLFKWIR